MLHLRNLKSVACMVVAASLLTACSGNKSAEKIAKEKNLSPIEVLALQSCLSVSKTKRLFVLNGKKRISFAKPPTEFCACQAPVMASVLTEEGFAENDKVLATFGPGADVEKQELDPAAIKPDIPIASAWAQLESNVKPCIIRAKAEIVRRQEIAKKQANAAKKKKPS